MGAIIMLLTFVGAIVGLVGGILILIEAFKESIAWGLCSLLIPLVALFFVFDHWEVSKKGVFIGLAGFGIQVVAIILGVVIGASSAGAV